MCSAPDVRLQRSLLATGLDLHWLRVANVRPTLEWRKGPAQVLLKLHEDEQPQFQEVENGLYIRTHDLWPENPLFSVLAVELAAIVSLIAT